MQSGKGGEVDMSAFLQKLAEINDAVSAKASKDDLNKLRIELQNYADKADSKM